MTRQRERTLRVFLEEMRETDLSAVDLRREFGGDPMAWAEGTLLTMRSEVVPSRRTDQSQTGKRRPSAPGKKKQRDACTSTHSTQRKRRESEEALVCSA